MAQEVSGQMTSLIDLQGITKVYETDPDEEDIRAIESIDLEVKDGEFLSIVGPSGCGKSTLLRIVAGLLDPTEGSVNIANQPVRGPVSDIGFVFQSPVLMDWRTVRENTMFPYEALKSNKGVEHDRSYYEQRADTLLDLVGLRDFEQSYPNQLSGGMKQRVSICRALLPDPQILLMDEPFGALDEFTREKLNRELLDIWDETQKTVLFVTHNISEAVYLSDRVVVLSERPGQINKAVDIELDRPRSLDIRDTPDFVRFVSEVREGIGVLENEGGS